MAKGEHFAMDGAIKTSLKEGYLRKGGQNATSQIIERPPAPAPMRAVASAAPKIEPKAEPA